MFHAQNGWFFSRNPDGSVVIEHRVYGTEKNEVGELMYTVDAKERILPDAWASVISSVSAGGEVDYRFYAAREFHNSTGRIEVKQLDKSEV
jgi:hypothetical protein